MANYNKQIYNRQMTYDRQTKKFIKGRFVYNCILKDKITDDVEKFIEKNLVNEYAILDIIKEQKNIDKELEFVTQKLSNELEAKRTEKPNQKPENANTEMECFGNKIDTERILEITITQKEINNIIQRKLIEDLSIIKDDYTKLKIFTNILNNANKIFDDNYKVFETKTKPKISENKTIEKQENKVDNHKQTIFEKIKKWRKEWN